MKKVFNSPLLLGLILLKKFKLYNEAMYCLNKIEYDNNFLLYLTQRIYRY